MQNQTQTIATVLSSRGMEQRSAEAGGAAKVQEVADQLRSLEGPMLKLDTEERALVTKWEADNS